MTAGELDGGPAIVNPARLAPERRDSICAQCHLTGAERVARPGRELDTFRPGELLSDFVTVFVRSGGAPGMLVTSHVEKLAQSACKRAAGDKLWCGSCHDPHARPAEAEKAAWFRAKCLTCHELNACSATEAVRRSRGDDCTACHMPRSTVLDADHVVFTDHSIPRRPGSSTPPPPPDAPLVRFDGAPAGPRDLGIAYASLAGRERVPAYQGRAFELLREAVSAGARDPQALLYLAELYKNRGDEKSALPLYEEAMRLDPDQVGASVALGALRADRGEWAEAIRLFQDALSKNPALVGVRTALAVALLQSGQAEQARAVLEKALEFDPAYGPARQLLNQMRKAP
jgi:tetratricopeptide (TPR) repeat protein